MQVGVLGGEYVDDGDDLITPQLSKSFPPMQMHCQASKRLPQQKDVPFKKNKDTVHRHPTTNKKKAHYQSRNIQLRLAGTERQTFVTIRRKPARKGEMHHYIIAEARSGEN
ncbi:hypothetical protein M409DRAFT_56062 [Zasmidium cellare ATCC 36951]|uniref:Uncharacterized protein n=1 Tax=Zasmidium cellare ATCC 36951 TaxID=1080233 RepID=A0A6A6CDB8_ZASCE|nr:uncharacterized protein M409DRAFT_56062 [Zasmidium cellare ATCC 36951]KAF2165184.1 hypothetical protein M409DRAFT_56062 [Zasmidium cellare ATCC 36951]